MNKLVMPSQGRVELYFERNMAFLKAFGEDDDPVVSLSLDQAEKVGTSLLEWFDSRLSSDEERRKKAAVRQQRFRARRISANESSGEA